MIPVPSPQAGRLIDKLREVIALPDNLTSLTLRVRMNDVVSVECTFSPDFVEPAPQAQEQDTTGTD